MEITSRPYYDYDLEAIVVDVDNHPTDNIRILARISDMAGELSNNGATKQEAIDYVVNIATREALEINAMTRGIKTAASDMYDHLRSL